VFAVALGIAAGALLRRTLPAMAITIGVFTLLRLVIGQDLRSHYLSAVTVISKFGHQMRNPAGAYWLISHGLVGRDGQVLSTPALGSGLVVDGVPVGELPPACHPLAYQGPVKLSSCLSAHGYRVLTSYQPADRYWAFQGIETGIYVLLAAALIAVTAIVVIRRDA
jgi:hypothetical protein